MIHELFLKYVSKRRKNTIQTLLHLPQLLRIHDDSHALENCILILGEMRSGTSWLGELVSKLVAGHSIFEPTNWEFSQFPDLGKRVLLYADEYSLDARLRQVYERILRGKLWPNYAVDRGNHPGTYECRVVKDLRMGWSIPFIRAHFPEVTMVYIIRHPFGSLRSQIKVASGNQLAISQWYYQKLQNHKELQETVWKQYGKLEIDSKDFSVYKLASWACHQRVVLDWLKDDGEIFLISYELLFGHPAETLSILQNEFEKAGFKTRPLNLREIRRPSRTTKPEEKAHVQTGRGLDKWSDCFTEEKIETYMKILQHFELDALYNSDGLPSEKLISRCVKF